METRQNPSDRLSNLTGLEIIVIQSFNFDPKTLLKFDIFWYCSVMKAQDTFFEGKNTDAASVMPLLYASHVYCS